MFVLIAFGVYIPHFVVGLLLYPITLISAYISYIYGLIFGKPHDKLHPFLKDVLIFYFNFSVGFFYIVSGYAPFFLQEESNFGVKIDIKLSKKINRLYSFFRLTGLIFVLTIPHIIKSIVLFIIFVIISLFHWPYLIVRQKTPNYLIKLTEYVFTHSLKLKSFILGINNNYPDLKKALFKKKQGMN